MSRGDYNGFSEKDQGKGGSIQSTAFANGMLIRQWRCQACSVKGYNPGDIIAHLEDYTNPIDGAIWLCYRCHTVLHARFKYPEGWDQYREDVRNGWRWPLSKSYHSVIEQHCVPSLGTMRFNRARRIGDPRPSTILDEIENGDHLPPGTPEEIRERMDAIWRLGIRYFRKEEQTLF